MDFGAGQYFPQLLRDRGDVGRAEPAVIFIGRHFGRVAPRKIIFWFGQRAHEHRAIAAGLACKSTGELEGRENRIVLPRTRGNDAGDGTRLGAVAGFHGENVTGIYGSALRERGTDHTFRRRVTRGRRVVSEPAALHAPPGVRHRHPRGKDRAI